MSVDRVMLVEDESGALDGISSLLHARVSGIHVESFCSVGSALDRINSGFSGVVMTDVPIALMNGIALLREARRARSDIPLVVMMVHYRYGLAIEALNAGAYAILSKPLKRDEFIGIVQDALRTNRLARVVEANRIVVQRNTQRLRALQTVLLPVPDPSTHETNRQYVPMGHAAATLASAVALLSEKVARGEARLKQSHRDLLAAQAEARLHAWLRAGERAEDLVPLSRYLS